MSSSRRTCWRGTSGTDAVSAPADKRRKRTDSLIGVGDLWESSSSDITDVASQSPTWTWVLPILLLRCGKVHTMAGASLGGTPMGGTTNQAS